MTTTVYKLVKGAGRVFPNPFSDERDFIRPKQGDSRKDALAAFTDMRVVGADMKKSIALELKKHGK